MDPKSLHALEYHQIRKFLGRFASLDSTLETLVLHEDAESLRNHFKRLEALEDLVAGQPFLLAGCLRPPVVDDLVGRKGCLPYQESLWDLLAHLRQYQRVTARISGAEKNVDCLEQWLPFMADLSPLLNKVERVFDDRGMVRDSASKKLSDIRKRQDGLMQKAQARISSLAQENAFHLRDQPPTLRAGRFVLPVRTDRGGVVKGILLERSGSGGTMFVEPFDMVDLNNDLVSIEDQEQEALAAIFKELAALAWESRDELHRSIEVLEKLDGLQACLLLGRLWQGIQPRISDGSEIKLKEARHPLLDERLNPIRRDLELPEIKFPCVPLTMDLDHNKPVLVISGPNAGGKTVALKTLGLMVLIAQSGIPVPASKGTVLPVLKQVFANIGDEQSIADSLSTFSARMVHLAHTLEQVKAPALVLLDELGSGTDPMEGGGIGGAALLEMTRRKVFTVATTHNDGLKALALEQEGMDNASVGFKEETYQPDFTLTMGQIQSSMAFAIAKRSGIPDGFLKEAKKLAGEGQTRLSKITQELEFARQSLHQEKISLVQEKQTLTQLQDKTRIDRQKLREKGQKAWDKRLASLDKLFNQEKRAFLKTLEGQKENAKYQETVEREVRKSTSVLKTKVLQKEQELGIKAPPKKAPKPARPIAEGDRVTVLSTGALGVVVEVLDAKKGFKVQVGQAQWTIKGSDLLLEIVKTRPKAPPKNKSISQKQSQDSEANPDPEMEINLIGQRVDSALPILDKSLDNAILAGQEWIRVIHGVGTGALRKAIREALDGHPGVANWEQPEQRQGGAGATLVRLAD